MLVTYITLCVHFFQLFSPPVLVHTDSNFAA
jgi:hypothetical protein